jgi:DDE superfamily endonuclease
LLFVEPPAGWRHGNVTEQRTKLAFAHQMHWWVDERSPEAEVIRVTMDNLHTQKLASLYEALPPAEARRIGRKLEFHYTPKHGNWWNMAAIEWSVLQQQCVDRRLPEAATLQRAIAAGEAQRNAERATMDWRFSVTDAREKLQRLYPSLSS